jgi:hypothetical protein
MVGRVIVGRVITVGNGGRPPMMDPTIGGRVGSGGSVIVGRTIGGRVIAGAGKLLAGRMSDMQRMNSSS